LRSKAKNNQGKGYRKMRIIEQGPYQFVNSKLDVTSLPINQKHKKLLPSTTTAPQNPNDITEFQFSMPVDQRQKKKCPPTIATISMFMHTLEKHHHLRVQLMSPITVTTKTKKGQV
jgi:hypothetical protein